MSKASSLASAARLPTLFSHSGSKTASSCKADVENWMSGRLLPKKDLFFHKQNCKVSSSLITTGCPAASRSPRGIDTPVV
eukprot:9503923-Pyramimonas_sp.AAC.4